MDKIEKIIIAAIAILIIIVYCVLFNSFKQIKNAGGIKTIIVNTGKEIKSMYKEIKE